MEWTHLELSDLELGIVFLGRHCLHTLTVSSQLLPSKLLRDLETRFSSQLGSA